MSPNVSGDVSPEYLTSRNYDYTIKAMPAILFLAITLLVGFVGNSLVCYVYLVKIKRTNAFANFILALAVLDLANCVTNIPFDIFHLSHRYTIGTYSLCYIKSVTNNLISLMSAIILLPMTVDRYRRVCRPLHRQMTASGAKLSIGLCCVATCILSVPCLFVYGPRNIPLNEGRINGTLCSISEKAGVLPLVYNGVVLVVFMAVFVTVVVVYSLIWCQLSQVTRFRTSSASGRIPSQTTLGINGEVVGRGKDLTRKRKASESDLLSTRSAMTQQQRNTVRQRTVMMFLISLIFVLSFLPHFGTMIATIFTKYVFDNLPTGQLALNNILLRSYFINSASNPIIYSICCVTFRRAIKKSFTIRRHSKTTYTPDCSEMKRLQCVSPQSPHPSVPEQTHSHSTPQSPSKHIATPPLSPRVNTKHSTPQSPSKHIVTPPLSPRANT